MFVYIINIFNLPVVMQWVLQKIGNLRLVIWAGWILASGIHFFPFSNAIFQSLSHIIKKKILFIINFHARSRKFSPRDVNCQLYVHAFFNVRHILLVWRDYSKTLLLILEKSLTIISCPVIWNMFSVLSMAWFCHF